MYSTIYCYSNRNDLISFNVKNNKQSYRNKDHEYARDRKRKRNKRQCVHNTQIHTTKYIEHVPNKPTTTSIRDR